MRTLSGTALLAIAIASARADGVRADEPIRLDGEPIEIVAYDDEADRVERSSAPVTVVRVDEARTRSADLADVVGRSEGVSVRRTGGLGSSARISLHGLEGSQIRYFLDGAPLEFSGFTGGLALVPLDLVDRVEIHRGVVPTRLGSDALGGAIALVSDPAREGTHVRGSLQAGSFGTYRLAALGSHRSTGGFFVRAGGFVDSAENDYPVHVTTASDTGALVPAVVHRFHDAYLGGGGAIELGFVDLPRASQVSLRAFGTTFSKEIQNNLTMTVPYGGATYGARSFGASLRYESPTAGRLHSAVIAGYARTNFRLRDVDPCAYDWFGRCLDTAPTPGELDGDPHDSRYAQDAVYARLSGELRLAEGRLLRLVLAPTVVTRAGEERELPDPTLADPLSGQRLIVAHVAAAEFVLDAFDDRLELTAFAKHYLQLAHADEVRSTSDVQRYEQTTQRPGFGVTARFRSSDRLTWKASYELATRLPSTDEIFGDGVLVRANYVLRPESSHNLNASVRIEEDEPRWGSIDVELGAFGRFVDDLIFLTGVAPNVRYKNVADARSVGVDGSFRYVTPREIATFGANLTFQDLRNRADQGDYAPFEGDRIPNRPWLFASSEVRLSARDLVAVGDELSLTIDARYVHRFYRAWESVGRADSKQRIPSQFVTGVALGYGARRDDLRIHATLEITNLTNARVYDNFGVERPGRAAYARLAIER